MRRWPAWSGQMRRSSRRRPTPARTSMRPTSPNATRVRRPTHCFCPRGPSPCSGRHELSGSRRSRTVGMNSRNDGSRSAALVDALPVETATVFLLGVVAVIAFAAAAAAGVGLYFLLGAVAILGGLAVTVSFFRRPIDTVLAFWLFLLFQRSIAAALGKSGGLGSAIALAENPGIILLL